MKTVNSISLRIVVVVIVVAGGKQAAAINLTNGFGDGDINVGAQQPATTGGNLTTTGQYGDCFFHPIGQVGSDSIYNSSLWISVNGVISSPEGSSAAEGFSNVTANSASSVFSVADLEFSLNQLVEMTYDPDTNARTGSVLRQQYIIHNPTDTQICFELIRYVDPDILGDVDDKAGIIPGDCATLIAYQFDADDPCAPANPTSFVGLQAFSPDSTECAFDIRPFRRLWLAIKSSGWGALDSDISDYDNDSDGFIDDVGDWTYAIGHRFVIEPGDHIIYQSDTLFGGGNPESYQVPDLKVTDIEAPDSGAAGQAVTITWTVENAGTEIAVGPWFDTIYLSDDSIIGGDIKLAICEYAAPLGLHESYINSQTVVLPANLLGPHHVVVLTDSNNSVPEFTGELNNAVLDEESIFIHQPDLEASRIVLPDLAYAGQSVNIEWRVTNIQDVNADGMWEDGVYLSYDSLIGDDMWLAGSDRPTPLGFNELYDTSAQVILPATIGEGLQWIIVRVDDANSIFEELEENNTIIEAIDIGLVPLISEIPDNTIANSTPYTGPEPALIQGTQPIIWSLIAPPHQSISIDQSTGVVSWPEPVASLEPYTIRIRAANSGGQDEEDWQLIVVGAPLIRPIDDANTVVGVPYYGPVPVLEFPTFVTWQLVEGPAGMTIDPATGRVTWLSPIESVTGHSITIRAVNIAGSHDQMWRLYVHGAPVIDQVDDAAIVGGSAYSCTPSLLAGAQQVTWTLVEGPPGMTININTGQVSWLNTVPSAQPYTIRIQATNPAGYDQEDWLLTVQAPPVIEEITDVTIDAGMPYEFAPTLVQGFFPAVTWELLAQPAGMTIDPTTGLVSWPYPIDSPTPHIIAIRATNSLGSDEETWQLTVRACPPVIFPIADDFYIDGQPYTGPKPQLTQGSPPVTWSLITGPEGMSIDRETGVVSWVTTTPLGSPHTITIRATNSWGNDLGIWQLTLLQAPDIVEIADDSVPQGLTYFGPEPVLAQGAEVTWSLVSGPEGMAINSETGVVSWPNAALEGSPHSITIRASNVLGSDDESWQLAVIARPDIEVAAIAPLAPEPAGTPVELSWTVINTGTGPAVGTWSEQVFASSDDQIGEDILLATFVFTDNSIAAAQSLIRTKQIAVPNLPGGYFVVVSIDTNLSLSELNENNNSRIADTRSEVALPDLVAQAIVGPNEAVADSTVQISWTVRNSGRATARAWWFDTVYLSLDKQVGDDIKVTNVARTDSLPESGEYAVTKNVTIPGQLTGDYYLLLVTDSTDTVTEDGVDSNNVVFASNPTTITQPPRPNLVVTDIITPPDGLVGQPTEVRWMVTNAGQVPAEGSWTDRIVASALDGGQGTVLAEVPRAASIPSQKYYEGVAQVTYPSREGEYRIVVDTDNADQVNEGVEGGETDNTTIDDETFVVDRYDVSVQADITEALSGTPVAITGHATHSASGGSVPNVPVAVGIAVRGIQRILSSTINNQPLVTDANGAYQTVFYPLSYEAGRYQLTAGPPGALYSVVQDEFILYGMRTEPQNVQFEVYPNGQYANYRISLVNSGDVQLTGLRASVVDAPNDLDVQVQLGGDVLSPLGSVPADVNVAAFQQMEGAYVTLSFYSAEGAAASSQLCVTTRIPEPTLNANPSRLDAEMLLGQQTLVEFDIQNIGAAVAEDIEVFLPSNTPWLTLSSPHIPDLAPGDSATILLQLLPDTHLMLGEYAGQLTVANTAWTYGVSVPYRFVATSDQLTNISVRVEDEYTYWSMGDYSTGGPLVDGALVRLLDPGDGTVVAETVSTADSNDAPPKSTAFGNAQFHNIVEGYYVLHIEAEDHIGFRETILVEAAKDNEFRAFLPRETVRYNWSVIETEIEDVTIVTLEAVFETEVPMPVITVDPPLVDLAKITDDAAQIDFTIENHGLVAVDDVTINFGSHPLWRFTPLIDELGILGARQRQVVPVLLERIPQEETSGADAASKEEEAEYIPCTHSASVGYSLVCLFKQYYAVPILIINTYGDCWEPTTGGSTGGGGWSGGGWSGGGWSGGDPSGGDLSSGGWVSVGGGSRGSSPDRPYAISPSYTPPEECDECDPNTYESQELTSIDVSDVFIPAELAAEGYIFAQTGGWISADVDITAKGSLNTCCINGGIGVEGGAQAIGEIELSLNNTNFKFEFDETLTLDVDLGDEKVPVEVAVHAEFEAGLNASTNAHIGGSGTTGCLLSHWQACIDGGIDADASVGLESYGEATVNVPGMGLNMASWTARAMVQTHADASFNWCTDSGFEGNTCFQGVYAEVALTIDLLGNTYTPVPCHRYFLVCPAGNCQPLSPCQNETGCKQIALSKTIDSPDTHLYDGLVAVPTKEEILAEIRKQIPHVICIGRLREASHGTSSPALRGDKIGATYTAKEDDQGICAKVRLRLDQQIAITRTAFTAMLEIENPDDIAPLEDIYVHFDIYDANRDLATTLFAIGEPALSEITAVDGMGVLGPAATGRVSWLIVPTCEAAPMLPTEYAVSGVFSYTQDGQQITVPLQSVSIIVRPDPSLAVKYFWQRDVFSDDPFTEEIEPSEPFSLGMIMANEGYGPANNVRITSSQPQIIENERDLLIEFELIGTKLGAETVSPTLSLNLGDVDTGEIVVAQWLMTSSLQGRFIDYSATYEHIDSLGDPRLSLIDSIDIYELIHVVLADRLGDDLIPDFLVNDVNDVYHLPDTLHLSDGQVEPVVTVTNASVDSPPTENDLEVELTIPDMSEDWTYVRIDDPANNQFKLVRVVRSDGKQILVSDNAWTTHRTIRDVNHPDWPGLPFEENLFHLFDFGGTGQYTLTYLAGDTERPFVRDLVVSDINEAGITSNLLTITFADNAAIDESSLDSFDIRVAGPAGFSRLATFISVDAPGDGTPRTATYRIDDPDGSWQEIGSGVYSILIEPNQVEDASGNSVEEGLVGTFTVDIILCGLEVESFNRMDRRRVGETLFEYDYTLTMHNTCTTPVSDVRFQITSLPSNMSLLSQNIIFEHVGPDESVTGLGMLTIQVDHSKPTDMSAMMWRIIPYFQADFTHDGAIGFGDLALLCGYWLQDEPAMDIAPPPDGDGIVSLPDFAALAELWLEGLGR